MTWPYNVILAVPAVIVFGFLLGCAVNAVHDYPSLGLRIHQVGVGRVHKECGQDHEACAFVGGKPCEIWVYKPSDLTHELRHCAGGDEAAATADDW